MSQINIEGSPGVLNAGLQDQGNVRNEGLRPRADLPPELQNARPSKGSIFARIGAFLFGAGAAGGASALLGGSTLLSAALGAGATAALGGVALAGIATGGAALLGGLVGIGIFAGIMAIVNHCRRAPDPDPRLHDLQPDALPQAQPAADAFNSSVAEVLRCGEGVLPASLQQAADETVSRMREIYGEDLLPQGAALHMLLDIFASGCGARIRDLGDAVSPEQFSSILEEDLRESMAQKAMQKAIRPFCGEDDNLPMKLRINMSYRHPELEERLKNAGSAEEVQDILSGAEDKISDMVRLHESMDSDALLESTRTRMISAIARGLGLDADSVAPHVDTFKCGDAVRELRNNIMKGKVVVDVHDIGQKFDRLADDLAKNYTDSFAAVDDAEGLSEEARKALKMEILTKKLMIPDPELYRKGLAAGRSVDASPLMEAFDTGQTKETLVAKMTALGAQIDEAISKQFGPAAWSRLVNTKPEEFMLTRGVAFMAMIDKVPGLREALAGRNDIDISEEYDRVRNDPDAGDAKKIGISVVLAGLLRVQTAGKFAGDFSSMQAQSKRS